jgi:hypothetical protein
VKTPDITAYVRAQKPAHAAICRLLRQEITDTLPQAAARLYHGRPAWFVGENAVVGFSVTARGEVCLLFWNGRAIEDPVLEHVGKFQAAQVRYHAAADVDRAALRRWLRVAGREVWDYAGMRRRH